MELKLRRLYLYATSTHAAINNPYETVEQFTEKKQKDISTLKDLLNNRLELPPISSLLLDVRNHRLELKNETSPTIGTKSPKNSVGFATKAKILTRKKLNASNIQDLDSKLEEEQREIEIIVNSSADRQIHEKYDKFINDYIEKIKEQKILEKEEIDHAELVKQAVEEIKNKFEENERQRNLRDQKKVKQGYLKNLSHLSLHEEQKLRGKETADDNDLLQEYKVAKNLRKRLSQKKSHSLNKISHKRRFSSIQNKIEEPSKLYLKLSNKSSNKDLRRLFQEGAHQRAVSNASRNVFEKNLECLRKKNEFIEKERRKSAAYFARSLYKHSFHYGDRKYQ